MASTDDHRYAAYYEATRSDPSLPRVAALIRLFTGWKGTLGAVQNPEGAVSMLKLGTLWCAGLALLLIPSPWTWRYASLGAVGAVAWFTENPGPPPAGGP